ncbi:MAG: hypothetical protein IJG37_10190, partial [Synergistaceae bacterium]|nr:hypothetical protein [Synergistaceae bacterium]
ISGGAFMYVNAEGCSALSVVNAENCADLETLLCGSCSISELYLAGCTSLKILDFSLNAIRKFDARGFTALETLECEGQTITGQVLTKSFAFRDFLNDSDDENVNNITGFNASGQEIDAVYDEATGLLTFTQLPYRITYNYMTLDTLSMDVTVYGETAPALSGSSFTINGTVGTAISALTITASSGDNLVWTTSGSLPSGLSGAAASDGMSYTISGTPNSAGTFTYTVTASNSAGSADAVVNVNIAAAPVTPEPEPEPEPEPVISPDVEPESGDVEPVSGDVEPVSGDVEPVSGDVEPVSGDVEPVSGDVEPVSGDVEPVSGDVEPVSGDIEPVSGDIEPVSGDIEPEPTPGDESEDVRPTPTPTPTPSDNSGDIESEPTPTPSDNSGDIEPEPTPTPNDDSGDIEPEPTPTSGDDEPEVEPVSAEIEKPAVDVTSRSVINTITEIFRAISQTVSNLINGGTEIAELPEEASGSERTIDDLSDEDLAAIPEGQTPAVIIPIIVVDAAKIYVFGVAIPNLQPGAPIFWNPMAQSLTAAGIFSAADYDNTSAYTFLDDDGHETAVVPANQHINVAAYLEPGKTYAPIITTAASSSGNNGNGDNNNSEGSDETAHVGSSGGGCYSGMSLIASVIACGMFLLKRKQS